MVNLYVEKWKTPMTKEKKDHHCSFDFSPDHDDLLVCPTDHWCLLLLDRRAKVLAELLALGFLTGKAKAEALLNITTKRI